MAESQFWHDKVRAQELMAEAAILRGWLIPYEKIKSRFSGLEELLTACENNDQDFLKELMREIIFIEKELESLEIKKMLSGELDSKNCFLSINAGAGGTEACDWVAMLARMYQRWAEKI